MAGQGEYRESEWRNRAVTMLTSHGENGFPLFKKFSDRLQGQWIIWRKNKAKER